MWIVCGDPFQDAGDARPTRTVLNRSASVSGSSHHASDLQKESIGRSGAAALERWARFDAVQRLLPLPKVGEHGLLSSCWSRAARRLSRRGSLRWHVRSTLIMCLADPNSLCTTNIVGDRLLEVQRPSNRLPVQPRCRQGHAALERLEADGARCGHHRAGKYGQDACARGQVRASRCWGRWRWRQ